MAGQHRIPGAYGANKRMLDSANFDLSFLVSITSSQHGQVVSRVPERVSINLQSEWDTVLGGGVSKFFNFALQETAGISANTKFSTAQGWQGTAPIEITLPLDFYAEQSIANEVVNPIATLTKMALPRANGSFYAPPGPRVFSNLAERFTVDTDSDHISVVIPGFLELTNMIVVSVNQEWVTRDMHKDGPLRASCSVTFRTLFAFTQQDIEDSFLGFNGARTSD